VPTMITEAYLNSLFESGANFFRYQVTIDANNPIVMEETSWKAWVRSHLDHLDAILIPASKDNAKFVLSIHTAPGGVTATVHNLWHLPWAREALLSMWEEIAIRYLGKEDPYVFGILNEPGGKPSQVRSLMIDARKRIRKIDRKRRISITSAYSDPRKWSAIPVFKDDNIWYEIHYYIPSSFTHQGINGAPSGKVYPTDSNDKPRMLRSLAKIRAWQTKNRKRIYVGET